jgi:hypothetical protein
VPRDVVDLDPEQQCGICEIDRDDTGVELDEHLAIEREPGCRECSVESKLQIGVGRAQPLGTGLDHPGQTHGAGTALLAERPSRPTCGLHRRHPPVEHLFEDGLERRVVEVPRQIAQQPGGAEHPEPTMFHDVRVAEEVGLVRVDVGHVDRATGEDVDIVGRHLAKSPDARSARTGQHGVRREQQRCEAPLLERHGVAREPEDPTVDDGPEA